MMPETIIQKISWEMAGMVESCIYEYITFKYGILDRKAALGYMLSHKDSFVGKHYEHGKRKEFYDSGVLFLTVEYENNFENESLDIKITKVWKGEK